MSKIVYRGCTCLALALVDIVILSNAQDCFAAAEGDIEHLKLIVTAHQANRAAIDTCQGRAEIESTFADINGPVLQDSFLVEFLSDCRREVTRWTWTHDERYVREGLEFNGEPIPKTVSEPVNAMTTRMGYYHRAPSITTREGERLCTLVIWPLERARRSYEGCFDPMWYLTGHKTLCTDDLVERLVFLYRRVKNEGDQRIKATREGDGVILELDWGTVLNRHTFSLVRGGNVVKYFGRDQNSTDRREWTYEQKNGVWVPKTFVSNYKTDSPEFLGNTSRTWKVTFVENIVNERIPLSEFSLKALGYNSSEQLEDRREYHAPIYDNTRTWDERILREIEALPAPAPYEELPLDFAPPLLGKPLPEFYCIGIPLEHVPDTSLLVYFFDLNQRPSRNCIDQLAKQAERLKRQGVTLVATQASTVEKNDLDTWVKKHNILFPVGMIMGGEEKERFNWGVKSLPWLILTDEDHIVRAEGFGLDELEAKIHEAGDAK